MYFIDNISNDHSQYNKQDKSQYLFQEKPFTLFVFLIAVTYPVKLRG